MRVYCFGSRWIFALFSFFVITCFPHTAEAEGINYQARLIWGTDEMKPEKPNLKELDAKTKDKLKAIFKWKNYFEVDSQVVMVGANELKKVKMSTKCEIEIQDLGKNGVEVKLFGEGKLNKKVKQVLPAGECLVMAGDDSNANAWFVMLCPTGK